MSIFGLLLALVSIVFASIFVVLHAISFVKKDGNTKYYFVLIVGNIAVMVIGLIIATYDALLPTI